MNALEMKQKLKRIDNSMTFVKLLGICVLLSVVIFPLNYWLNPNVDPIVRDSPFLLGFGFMAFVAMFLIFGMFGLVFTAIALDSYLFFSPKFLNAYDRFNASSILRNDYVANEMAKGIHTNFLKLSKKDNDPRFAEFEAKYERQHNEHMENERLYLNHNLRLTHKLEKQIEKNFKLEQENINQKKFNEKVQSDLQNALSSIAQSKEKISELEKVVKTLQGDKDHAL